MVIYFLCLTHLRLFGLKKKITHLGLCILCSTIDTHSKLQLPCVFCSPVAYSGQSGMDFMFGILSQVLVPCGMVIYVYFEKKIIIFFCILHMLCVITSQGELEDDLDNRVGFFRGSPPVRTNNPLVHDLQFVTRASLLPTSAAIPLSPTGRKFSSAGKPLGRTDGATSPLSDRNQKPGVRIEGFACDNSDFECCEQAPAPLPR